MGTEKNEAEVVGSKVKFPLTDAIVSALKMINAPELVDYYEKAWEKKLDDCGKAFKEQFEEGHVFAPIQKLVSDFLAIRRNEFADRGSEWDGVVPKNTYQTLQNNFAAEALQNLETESLKNIPQISIAFNVDKEGLLSILYNQNKEGKLPPLLVESLNALTGAYFAENNLVSVDGLLYETDQHGSVLKDEQGKDKRTAQKMEDTAAGFETFLKGKGITLASEGVAVTHQEKVELEAEIVQERSSSEAPS